MASNSKERLDRILSFNCSLVRSFKLLLMPTCKYMADFKDVIAAENQIYLFKAFATAAESRLVQRLPSKLRSFSHGLSTGIHSP